MVDSPLISMYEGPTVLLKRWTIGTYEHINIALPRMPLALVYKEIEPIGKRIV